MRINTRFLFFVIIPVLLSLQIKAQPIPIDSMYFGQTPPGKTPVLFAPGIISLPGRNEPCITFSPDGKSAYFYIEFWPGPGTPYVMFSEYNNGVWSTPAKPAFATGRLTGEPFFSIDGKRIYLNATGAVSQVGLVDLSYVQKTNSVWGNPVSLGNPPNLTQDQYHSCVVSDTSIYFSSSGGTICRSQYKNGVYQTRTTLPSPINYRNTTQTWGDPYVVPDESYLIMKSTREGGYGGNDIYIAYRKTDKTWTNPKNLGGEINTSGEETSGDITPDGKYMTFGRGGDMYWVSAYFIDSLKHTNFIPYLRNQIPTQSVQAGHLFNYTVPDTTFIDDDGNNTLTYTAALANGNPLPGWLTFNPSTRTFSGTPDQVGNISVKVIATDSANVSVPCSFVITVLTGMKDESGTLPKSPDLLQNYPNPFNPSTKIEFAVSKTGRYAIRVFNMLGRLVKVISDKEYTAGYHEETFNSEGLASGIYIYRLLGENVNILRKMVLLR